MAGTASLVAESKEKIRSFLSRYGPDYLYVLVSGGKDSAAVWSLANDVTRDYVVVFIHIPGQTHADNIRAVYGIAERLNVKYRVTVRVDETRKIMERLREAVETCGGLPCLLHVVSFTHRGEDFWQAMMRYGYPAPLSRFGKGVRWCCGTFKHRVFNRLPYNGRRNGTPWRYGVDGVKATDSPYRRRKFSSDVITWEKTRDTYLFPIRTYTDEQVWEVLRLYELYDVVYAQYARWGRSPNCSFCPMIGRLELIEQTVKAMSPQLRLHVYIHLKKLLPRYRETTFSYKSTTKWLSVLEKYVDTERIDVIGVLAAGQQPGKASVEA